MPDSDAGAAKAPPPRPFSVVLAPGTTVNMRGGSGHFVRYLYCGDTQATGRLTSGAADKRSSSGLNSGSSSTSSAPPLSDVIIAVKAQPCTLHLFRGRRLCRVVEFDSPVVDVAGVLPRPPQGPEAQLLLCVVVCRDGTTYALPAAEVLEGRRQAPADTPGRVSTVTGHSVGGSKKQQNGDNDTAPATVLTQNKHKAQNNDRAPPSSSSSTAASKVDIFEDLAPTMVDDIPLSSKHPQQRHGSHAGNGTTANGGGDGGRSSVATGSGTIPLAGLVLRAHNRWVVCTHFGARRVASCPGDIAAVVGIVDRASLYGLPAGSSDTGSGGGVLPTTRARFVCTVDGVDGAAPTTVTVVWAGEQRQVAGGGTARIDSTGVAIGDNKGGFPLPPRVFRALFGAELALSATPFPRHQPAAPAADDRSDTCVARAAESSRSGPANGPAVLLVGDEMGTVRWAPLHPCPGVVGGVLANLGDQAVVATVPQLDSEGKVVGLLAVGAKGGVLSLTETPRRTSRKRARPETAAGGGLDGETITVEGDRPEGTGPPCLRRRVFKLPFRVSSGCSTPGFLVHCHAGALFATAIPQEVPPEEELEGRDVRGAGGKLLDCSDTQTSLRPVRLPLPSETIDVAVARVLADDDGTHVLKHSPTTPRSVRTLVVSLSARGRLVGFLAPSSTEELEGWGLDTGKGGVRVGGTAGIERRVRCQLERLSNVGLQCAALSAESVKRDAEIRILRGATRLIPTLVAACGGGNGTSGSWDGGAVSPALGHAVSMGPDAEQTATSFDEVMGEAGLSDTLRVRLLVKLWSLDGARATGLPKPGAEGAGRWFLVTQVVSEMAVGPADGGWMTSGATAEGWAWSTSAAVPMSSLRQGRAWSKSLPLTLPSARPVVVTSWLQFCFAGDVCVSESAAGGGAARETAARVPAGGCGSEICGVEAAEGVCLELGRARFDILDWGVPLPSVPASMAAVRAAAAGRGACFCGPEMAIADFLERSSKFPADRPRSAGGKAFASMFSFAASAPPVTQLPVAWGNFRLLVASLDGDSGALLARLVRNWASPSAGSAHQNAFAPAMGARSGARSGGGDSAEVAVRVAGQVAVLRAHPFPGIKAAGTVWGGGSGGGGGAQARSSQQRAEKVIEIAVTCSHEAMSPLVRQALLRRASVSKGRDGSDKARGEAAARLTRGLHPLRQAVNDVSDSARALGVARAREGPQLGTAKEALSLLGTVGGIYQTLRLQQGGGAVV